MSGHDLLSSSGLSIVGEKSDSPMPTALSGRSEEDEVQSGLLDKRPKTPLFLFERYRGIDLYIKFEGANPSLCLKTRSAAHILRNMKARCELSSEKTVIDASSGSHGGALAWVAGILGIDARS